MVKKNTRELFASACRYAVRRQIQAWRKKNNANRVCKQCKTTQNLQVDHIRPFSLISKEFQSKVDYIPYRYRFIKRYKRIAFLQRDEKFIRKWQRFHHKSATYQWLCKACNLKKFNNTT